MPSNVALRQLLKGTRVGASTADAILGWTASASGMLPTADARYELSSDVPGSPSSMVPVPASAEPAFIVLTTGLIHFFLELGADPVPSDLLLISKTPISARRCQILKNHRHSAQKVVRATIGHFGVTRLGNTSS